MWYFLLGTKCRVYKGPNGTERVRCDQNIEIRNDNFSQVREVEIDPFDPCADRLNNDTSGLCLDDEEKND